MSDSETFAVALAGRDWELPHLPFRLVKAIQPELFAIYGEAGGADMSAASVATLTEAQIDRLAKAIWRALAFVEPGLTFDAFLDLPFTLQELFSAFPAVASAAGLRASKKSAAPGESPAPGK